MGKETIHICRKERELGIMATQIENIEKTTTETNKRLNDFIDKADSKYATKEELHTSINNLNQVNKRQDEEIKWGKKQIMQLVKDVGIALAIIAIIAKQLNLY